MSADGSTGRRDGFDRWVASMKTDHEPVQAKSSPLKPNVHQKLELDLDENATHVHRIPKEVINRMREQRAQEKQSAESRPSAPDSRPSAPDSRPSAPDSRPSAPEQRPSAPEQRRPRESEREVSGARAVDQKALLQQAFGSEDEDDEVESALGGLSDDRTAVFRPPPELLARAKRMKPPSKPNPQSEAPTKPPPAPAAGAWIEPGVGVPAAAKVPGIEQPLSSRELERSAVFDSGEPSSGVVSLGVPEEAAFMPAAGEAFVFEEPALPPISNDALLAASMADVAPEPLGVAVTNPTEEESPAPTTTSPLVRSEPSAPPAAPRTTSSSWTLWVVALLAAAALVAWRLRHHFHF